jgi:hypothetical protein
MDIVVVSGFGAMIGLGMPCWALAKDAKTETDTMPTGTTTRATDRNIKKSSNHGIALLDPLFIDGKYRSGKELRDLVVDGSRADVRFCQSVFANERQAATPFCQMADQTGPAGTLPCPAHVHSGQRQ